MHTLSSIFTGSVCDSTVALALGPVMSSVGTDEDTSSGVYRASVYN